MIREPRPLPLFLQMLLQHAGSDSALIRNVLSGVNAYRAAPRQPRAADRPVVAQVGRARLLDYGGTGRTLVFVPSLINPPYVLDLAPDNSLLGWLATRNVRPLLVDWGSPVDGQPDLSVGGHVEACLRPLLAGLDEPPVLAGYCLGGTMALAAATRVPVRGVITIATPWHFDGFSSVDRTAMAQLWESCRPIAETIGLFPMEFLQMGFWQLDPMRTLRKYADFGTLPAESPAADAFIALEDWANDGPPLTLPAAQELLVDMMRDNRTGQGNWTVGGRTVDPANIAAPLLNIVSTRDRIVPAATAPRAGDHVMLDQGHVGMVVGSGARTGLWALVERWLAELG